MSKRPSSIYNDPGYYYKTRTLLKIFAFSTAALMVGILWMIWVDFDRPWKDEQRAQMKWEARKGALERMLLQTQSQELRARLEADRAKALAAIDAREAEIQELNAKLDGAQGAFYRADMDYKEQKQYTTEAEYRVHEARSTGELEQWTKKFKSELDYEHRLRDARQVAEADLNLLLASRKRLNRELDKIVEDERASAELKKIAVLDGAIKKKRGYSPLREIPLLDFLAPPTKIEQVVLDDLVDNYEFATPKKVDRCGTCHIGAMRVGFEAEKFPVELVGDYEGARGKAFEEAVYRFVFDTIESVTPKIDANDPYFFENDLQRRVDIHHKALTLMFADYDDEMGDIAVDKDQKKIWRKWKRDDQGKWVNAKDGHGIDAYFVTVLQQMRAHWRTHPHFDDMVGGSSPHPYEKFGCTTCHFGRNWSVDFGYAWHTPDKKLVDDWMTEERAHDDGHHLPRSAHQTLAEAMNAGLGSVEADKDANEEQLAALRVGWVKDSAQEKRWKTDLGRSKLKLKYWVWPQLPKMLIQSSCLKCHKEGLYATPAEEYAKIRIGRPDTEVPDTLDWSDHALEANESDAEGAFTRLFIPKDPEPYRPRNLERGLDNFVRFGCYGCHKLDPTQYTFMDNVRPKVGPQLDEVSLKLNDEEWLRKWVRNPKDYRPDTRMPAFFQQSNSSHDFRFRFADQGYDEVDGKAWADAEIYAISRYLWHRSETRKDKRTLPAVDLSKGDVKRGEHFVVGDALATEGRAKACVACHEVPVRDPDLQYDTAQLAAWTDAATLQSGGWKARMSRRQGPSLMGLGSKVTPEWFVFWLKNPRSWWHNTNMPDLRLTDQEALDIAAYLLGFKATAFDAAPPVALQQQVIDKIAEELKVAEQKESTERALSIVKRMKPEERTLYVGSKLVKHYGCFGCHLIEEYKDATPIGTELTEWGSKLIERLEFNHAPIEHTHFDFAYTKLVNPRIYDYGMPRRHKPFERLKMPRFGFTPEEARDIAMVLVGLVSDPIPEPSLFKPDPWQADVIRGRQIVKKYNCQGCHMIENEGGDIWPTIEKTKWRPPDLLGQGIKTQPAWLFQFMKDPTFVVLPGQEATTDRVRPWHSIRMPTFHLTDEETRAVVRYFAALSREAPADFETPEPDSLTQPFDPAEYPKTLSVKNPDDRDKTVKVTVRNPVEEARMLFQELQCKSCHTTEVKIEDQAPGFRHSRDGRLRETWMLHWLWGPSKLQPGTAMPTFFANEDGPMVQDAQFFGGDADRQVRALRDYARHHYREEDR